MPSARPKPDAAAPNRCIVSIGSWFLAVCLNRPLLLPDENGWQVNVLKSVREKRAMKSAAIRISMVVLILTASVAVFCDVALAQLPPVAPTSAATLAFGVLVGRWVRTEGPYTISINAVDSSGKLDAGYANPRPLPFHTAEATRDGDALKLFFELRAGGYGGSTYTLTYDAASDSLRGVYDQVVVKQKFDVVFNRSK
jgi:hypothetical protein